MPLRIVADENIAGAKEVFGLLGQVQTLPGQAITREHLRRADILLVRSITPVGAPLLEGTPVRFVGSATSGTDHVDEAYLGDRGIVFAHAPGANAEAVVEYVLTALLELAVAHGEELQTRRVGIVGCGQIGGRLYRRLEALGVPVRGTDPPLARRQPGVPFHLVELPDLMAWASVLTLHVPLTYEGPEATYHLMDAERLARCMPGAWLINAARGAVVDNEALKLRRRQGEGPVAVLDVWEHEPEIDVELLEHVFIGTPHIAGYGEEARWQGTRRLFEALTEFLGERIPWPEAVEPPRPPVPLEIPPFRGAVTPWLRALVRQAYPIWRDDRKLRRMREVPPEERGAYFLALRKHYPRRPSFRRFTFDPRRVPEALMPMLAEGLGFTPAG